MATSFQLHIEFFRYQNAAELPEQLQQLPALAQKASANAYAPYSRFHVGAALLLEDGNIVLGNNQENSAYPSGLCAERTAIFAASANFPNKKIVAIAIAAKPQYLDDFIAVTPCGGCRQVLSEYENKQNHPIQMLMSDENGHIILVPSIDALLPLKFSGKSLNN